LRLPVGEDAASPLLLLTRLGLALAVALELEELLEVVNGLLERLPGLPLKKLAVVGGDGHGHVRHVALLWSRRQGPTFDVSARRLRCASESRHSGATGRAVHAAPPHCLTAPTLRRSADECNQFQPW
jgi:hypothetical protein